MPSILSVPKKFLVLKIGKKMIMIIGIKFLIDNKLFLIDRILPPFVLLFLSIALGAQQEELEGSQVEIIKNFEATIEDAQMVKFNPSVPYPVPLNRTYKYDVTVVQLPLKYPEPVIQALSMKKDNPFDAKKFYVKGGYGSLANPFANMRYAHHLSDLYAFDVAVDHFSLDNSSRQNFQKMTNTTIGLNTKFRIGENVHLHAGGDFMTDRRYLYFIFRDFSTIRDENELKRNHQRYGYRVGISNIEHTTSGINYSLFLNQHLTTINNPGTKELNTILKGYLEKRNSDKINIEVPFSAQFTNLKPQEGRFNFYTFQLKPRINFHTGRFQATLGGNLLTDKAETSPFPEIQLALGVASNYIQLLLGVDQAYHTNNLAMSLQTCPWFSGRLDTILNTVAQNYYGGIRGDLSFVNYEAKAGIRNFKNMSLFQSSGEGGLVNILFDRVKSIFITGNIDFAYSDKLSLGGEVTKHFFNAENEARIWGIPSMELRAYALFKPFGSTLEFKGELFFKDRNFTLNDNVELVRLNNLVELNAAASYTFNKTVGFFVEANNILNVKYQRWYGFPTVGINFAAGITMSL